MVKFNSKHMIDILFSSKIMGCPVVSVYCTQWCYQEVYCSKYRKKKNKESVCIEELVLEMNSHANAAYLSFKVRLKISHIILDEF